MNNMHTSLPARIHYLKNGQQQPSTPDGLPPEWMLRLIRLSFRITGHLLPRLAARRALNLFIAPRRRNKPAPLKPILKTAQAFQLPHKGGYLQAYAWGQGEERVLLVHGWNSKASHWSAFIPTLVAAGYQVIALDNPAHGLSDGATTDLADTCDAIRAVVHCFGSVDHIIAHSFGAAASSILLWDTAADISVKKLVLMGAPVRLQWVIDDYASKICLPKTAQKWLETYLERTVNRKISEFDLTRVGNDLRADQLLIIHDEQDASVPVSEALRLASLDRPPAFLVLEGFGHFGMIKSALVAEETVRFLRQA